MDNKVIYTFFELLGNDILKVVEEVRYKGRILGNFNSSFIAEILKVDYLETFEVFIPISPYNRIYNIILNVIPLILNPSLSSFIFDEQFRFL